MLTPEEIQERDFLVSLRGFDRAEVRAFLTEVADHVRELEERAHAADTAHVEETARAVEAAEARAVTGRDEQAPAAVSDASAIFADIGRETQGILESAHEAAESILRQARVDADREVQAARRQAARLIAEGEQRREETEETVAGLEAARGALSSQLREIETMIERIIGELAAPPPPATTVREALTAEVGRRAAERTERTAPPSRPRPEPSERTERSEPDEQTERSEPVEPTEEPEPVQQTEKPEREEQESQDQEGEEAERDEQEVHTSRDEEPSGPEPEQPVAPPEPAEPVTQHHTPDQPEAAGGDGRRETTGAGLASAAVADDVVKESSDPLGLRGSALAPLHPQLVRAIKRGLQDMQNVALDRLRRTRGEGGPESLLPTHEEVHAIAASAADFLQQAYVAGGVAASLLVDRDLPRPAAERALADDFVADASQRVGSPLAATLRMARSADEGAPALLDRVGAVFAELKGTVAEELATTHLMRAYELGLLDAWAAGGITHRRWVLGREPRCPEARCRHNDQAGVVAMGESYPSGHEVPPVHVGCNCTTIPISESPA